MKNKIFILGSIFLISVLYGQSPNLNPDLTGISNDHNLIRDYANNWANNVNKSIDMDDLKKSAKGTPYYDDKFYNAKLDGSFSVPNKLRYNAYSDQMEFMKDNVTYEINKIEGISLNFPEINKTYIVAQIAENNKSSLTYLKQIVSGKYGLYERQRIILKGGDGTNNGIVDNTGYVFSSQKSVFYLKVNDTYLQIPAKASDFKSKFPQLFDKLNSKINLSKVNDLEIFVKELNK